MSKKKGCNAAPILGIHELRGGLKGVYHLPHSNEQHGNSVLKVKLKTLRDGQQALYLEDVTCGHPLYQGWTDLQKGFNEGTMRRPEVCFIFFPPEQNTNLPRKMRDDKKRFIGRFRLYIQQIIQGKSVDHWKPTGVTAEIATIPPRQKPEPIMRRPEKRIGVMT